MSLESREWKQKRLKIVKNLIENISIENRQK